MKKETVMEDELWKMNEFRSGGLIFAEIHRFFEFLFGFQRFNVTVWY